MTIIYIKTNDGETIDRIPVEDAAIEDAAQLDYIHAALNDALIVAAKKQLSREAAAEKLLDHLLYIVDPDCACTPFIDEPCTHCQREEEKES